MNGLFIKGKGACWTNEKCYPATKEQRDILFQKMREAGYEWDADKKELRMIEKQSEQKTQRMVSAEAKEALYDKPKWSEEDERMLKGIISDVKFEGYNNYMQANSYKKIEWLKELKQRIGQ